MSKSLLFHHLPKSRPWDPSKIVDLAICYKLHQSRAPETFIRPTWWKKKVLHFFHPSKSARPELGPSSVSFWSHFGPQFGAPRSSKQNYWLDPAGVQQKKNGPAPGPRPKSVDGHFMFSYTWGPKKMKVSKKIKWIRPAPAPGSDLGGYPHLFFNGDLPNRHPPGWISF